MDRPIDCHVINPCEFVSERLRSALQSNWGKRREEGGNLGVFSILACSVFDQFWLSKEFRNGLPNVLCFLDSKMKVNEELSEQVEENQITLLSEDDQEYNSDDELDDAEDDEDDDEDDDDDDDDDDGNDDDEDDDEDDAPDAGNDDEDDEDEEEGDVQHGADPGDGDGDDDDDEDDDDDDDDDDDEEEDHGEEVVLSDLIS